VEQLIGLDVGYGFVKVTDAEEGYVFPSVVSIGHCGPSYAIRTRESVTVDDLKVIIGNQTYFVGKSAIQHSRIAFHDLSIAREENDDLRVLILASLGLFALRQGGDLNVVTGLPPGQLQLASEMEGRIKGEHVLGIFHGGEPVQVRLRVKNVQVVPQPLGTYWSHVLDIDGQVICPLGGRVGVVDIGFRTTDLAAIEHGEFLPEKSHTVAVGMNNVYRDIQSRLLTEYGIERESCYLDEAVIRGQINVAGQARDIPKLMDEPFQRLASRLMVEIVSSWNMPEFDTMLLSGGGSNALGRYLLDRVPQARAVQDPVTANSRGFPAWAHLLWGTEPRDQGRVPLPART